MKIEFTEYKKFLRIIVKDNLGTIIYKNYEYAWGLKKKQVPILFKNIRRLYIEKWNAKEIEEKVEKITNEEVNKWKIEGT